MARPTSAAGDHGGRNIADDTLRPMVRPSLERLDPLAVLTGREHANFSEDLYPVLYAAGSA